jgi:hypothetical protein
MDNKLDELAHVLGGCERLATTPVPFAYTLILQRTARLAQLANFVTGQQQDPVGGHRTGEDLRHPLLGQADGQ